MVTLHHFVSWDRVQFSHPIFTPWRLLSHFFSPQHSPLFFFSLFFHLCLERRPSSDDNPTNKTNWLGGRLHQLLWQQQAIRRGHDQRLSAPLVWTCLWKIRQSSFHKLLLGRCQCATVCCLKSSMAGGRGCLSSRRWTLHNSEECVWLFCRPSFFVCTESYRREGRKKATTLWFDEKSGVKTGVTWTVRRPTINQYTGFGRRFQILLFPKL